MTELRLPNTRPTPRLERGDEPPRPACDGEWGIFYALIDTPGNMYIRRDAAKFCGTCPLRDTCLPENIARGGDDAAWATAVVKELTRIKTRDCDYCGKAFAVHPQGVRRRFCNDTCRHASNHAKKTAA